jgi:dihydrofolate synthase / folylpolyglutamate synthase
LRVGLFTSPHLVSFRERIQVNRQLISEADIVRLVSEVRTSLERRSPDRPVDDVSQRADQEIGVPSGGQTIQPTLFEFATVMALKFFAEQKCDLVIWETGLGGRLDATNIVTPLASVITNIAFDHQQWLGDTLEKIAAEKAGIIKPGIPVVTATAAPEALAVIEKVAREKNAPLTLVTAEDAVRSSAFRRLPVAGRLKAELHAGDTLPLLGAHQKTNAALALATVEVLQKQIPVAEEKIREGLVNVNWPGRLQLIEKPDGQKILLDGAHNVAGAEALRAALAGGTPNFGSASCRLASKLADRKIGAPTLIAGFLGDKDWRAMAEILAPLASKIFTVPVASARTADASDLAITFRAANPAAKVIASKNLSEALNASKDEPFIIITGSLYLVGEALELLGHSPAGADERGLNEWAVVR